MAPEAPIMGTELVGVGDHLGSGRREAAEKVEDQKTNAAHGILDIVAENPEEPQVADNMEPAVVEEHVREKRLPVGRRGNDIVEMTAEWNTRAGRDGSEELSGNEPEGADRLEQRGVRSHPLDRDPDHDIGENEEKGGDGFVERRVVDTKREHLKKI